MKIQEQIDAYKATMANVGDKPTHTSATVWLTAMIVMMVLALHYLGKYEMDLSNAHVPVEAITNVITPLFLPVMTAWGWAIRRAIGNSGSNQQEGTK